MHRIPDPNGTYVQSELLRWLRTVAYLFMSASGVLLIVSPLTYVVYGVFGEAMSWFLVLGGLLASYGSWTHRWFGEFTGIPLLASAFATFGILVSRGSFLDAPYIALSNLFVLMGFSVVMAARWWVVFAVFRVAERNVDRGKRENEQL